jgi:small subunit ribosomal protein S16
MVKIRLRRTGAKKQPHYRVVVTDSKSPRDGRFIEIIGHYNPRTEPPTFEIDAERALYWLSVGAQPSEAVKRLLDKMGLMVQVPAVRKGELSIDEIVAQFLAAQEEPKVPVKREVAEVKAEAEAVEEEEEAEEEEVEFAEADEEWEDEDEEEWEDEEEDEEEEADWDEEEGEEADWEDEDEEEEDEEEEEPLDLEDEDDEDAEDVADDPAPEDEE